MSTKTKGYQLNLNFVCFLLTLHILQRKKSRLGLQQFKESEVKASHAYIGHYCKALLPLS